MKVLLFNQFFPPDGAPTGEQLADVAEALLKEGAEVTVVCSRSRYAEFEGRPAPAVKIVRVPGLPFGRDTAARLSSYGSYLLAAAWHGWRMARADVVVTMSTPPMLALVGAVIKALRGSRHVMWEMDLYPDVAIALGVIRPEAIWTRALKALAQAARRKADAIIVPGECMRRKLLGVGIPAARVHTAENWADEAPSRPRPRGQSGPLNILYAGNLGLSHEIDTICRVVEASWGNGRLRFVFSGGGALRPKLEGFCRLKRLDHVSFLPYQSQVGQSELLAEADVGLVTQRSETAGMLVPSKIYRLMGAAIPVLFIGPGESQAAQSILRHKCGWQFECGDWQGILDQLYRLDESRELIVEAGLRGRQAFLQTYNHHAGAARVVEVIQRVAAGDLVAAREESQCHSAT